MKLHKHGPMPVPSKDPVVDLLRAFATARTADDKHPADDAEGQQLAKTRRLRLIDAAATVPTTIEGAIMLAHAVVQEEEAKGPEGLPSATALAAICLFLESLQRGAVSGEAQGH